MIKYKYQNYYMIKVIFCNCKHKYKFLEEIHKGLKYRKIKTKCIKNIEQIQKNDIILIRGVLYGYDKVIKHCIENDITFFYIDNAFDSEYKNIKFSISKNSLQHFYKYELSNPVNKTILHNNNLDLKHILLAIPEQNIMSKLLNIDTITFTINTISKIRTYTNRKIIIRYKPNPSPDSNLDTHALINKLLPIYKNIEISANTLENDLDQSCILITSYSRISVDAIKRNIPIICDSICFAHSVSQTYDFFKNFEQEPQDYCSFFSNLSKSQFTLKQLKRNFFMNLCK